MAFAKPVAMKWSSQMLAGRIAFQKSSGTSHDSSHGAIMPFGCNKVVRPVLAGSGGAILQRQVNLGVQQTACTRVKKADFIQRADKLSYAV
jgi:hypothetical protein